MKLRATKRGEFPRGTHWTPGEVRDVQTDQPVPDWLEAVKAPAKKAKKPVAKE